MQETANLTSDVYRFHFFVFRSTTCFHAQNEVHEAQEPLPQRARRGSHQNFAFQYLSSV